MKQFRVIKAFDRYSVGAVIEPTGLVRGDLLRRGFIELIEEKPAFKREPIPLVKTKKQKHGDIE